MFKKLVEFIKATFEGNKCRFREECKLYTKNGIACNYWIERFPTYDKAYCGTYRNLDE